MSNIELKVAADVADARQKLEQINGSLSDMSGRMESARGKMTSLSLTFNQLSQSMNVVFGYAKNVYAQMKELVDIYAVQEQAEKKLQATLKATQSACGMTEDELEGLASALQGVTTYGDETILGLESLLVSTKAIGREVMPQAVEASLDLAAALGTDATQAAKTLAKALTSPKDNLDTLRRSNIQLTDVQKEEITALQEQGDLMAAQQRVLEAVSSAYGGIARSIAETDTGKLQQIKNVWGDIKEGLGKGLLDTISPALEALYEALVKISDKVSSMVNGTGTSSKIWEALQTAAGAGYNANIGEQGYLLRMGEEFADAFSSAEIADAIETAMGEMARGKTSDLYERMLGILFPAQDIRAARDKLEIPEVTATPYVYGGEALPEAAAGGGSEASWLDRHGSKSASYKQDSLKAEMQELKELASALDTASAEYGYLQEVIASLGQEYLSLFGDMDNGLASFDAYSAAAEAAAEAMAEAQAEAAEYAELVKSGAFEVVNSVMTISESFTGLFQQWADNAIDAYEEVADYWDDYLERLEESQDKQRDSLNAMLSDNLIAYEDYINAINQLDETQEEAKAEALAEEEAAQKEADEANRKAFEAEKANSLTQAVINAALGITDIWSKYSAVPAIAAILTAASAAATGAEIATISSQEYTPLAAGGIVTSPTPALIGEGGSAEAVLPLTETNMSRFGFTGSDGGVINITVQIENAYTDSDITEAVFKGIERAQRTGALPKWRYVS